MESLAKLINKIIIMINRIIDNFDNNTATTIRKLFFIFIFMAIIIGIVSGYNMGKNAAKIKSPPLAEYTDDLFSIMISKKQGKKGLTSLVSSNDIEKLHNLHATKIKPKQDKIDPNDFDAIIEPNTYIERSNKNRNIKKTDLIDTIQIAPIVKKSSVERLDKRESSIDIKQNKLNIVKKSVISKKESSSKNFNPSKRLPTNNNTSEPLDIKGDIF